MVQVYAAQVVANQRRIVLHAIQTKLSALHVPLDTNLNQGHVLGVQMTNAVQKGTQEVIQSLLAVIHAQRMRLNVPVVHLGRNFHQEDA